MGSLISSSETSINTTTINNQYVPTVAALANGTQVVTWASYGQDGAGYGIYARLLDANGIPIGGEFRVNSTTNLNESTPTIVALGNGGFMIAWQAYQATAGTNPSAIYAQRFDSFGTAIGTQMTLASGGNVSVPKATALTDGSTFIVWQADYAKCVGYRLSADGLLASNLIDVSTYKANGSISGPSVTGLSDGRYLVTWSAYTNQLGRGLDVYGQIYSTANTPLGSTFLVNAINNTATYDEVQSTATGLVGGGFVIAWTALNDHDGNGHGVFMRQYNAAGQPLTAERRVSSFVVGNQSLPSVTALVDGGYMVAWTSTDQDGSGTGVYAERFDASGRLQGGPFQLAEEVTGDQGRPILAARPDGGFVAVWHGQDGSGFGVKIREFSVSPVAPAFISQDLLLDYKKSVLGSTLIRLDHIQGNDWATSGLQQITQYQFIDCNAKPGSGYFVYNGSTIAAGQNFTISASQLPNLRFVSGSSDGTDAIMVRVSDGIHWSDWQVATVTTELPSMPQQAKEEFFGNSTTFGDQYAPSVAVLPNGTRVVTWASYGQDGAGYGVYARLFDSNGTPLSSEFLVNGTTNLNENTPTVSALGDGGFIIFWQAYQSTIGQNPTSIYGQRYDSMGQPIGMQLTPAYGGNVSAPRSAQLADGSVFAVWQTGTSQITGARYDSNGLNIINTLSEVSTYKGNGQVCDPNVAGLSDGRYLVTYSAYVNQTGRGWDVYGQLYSSNNAAIGSAFQINANGGATTFNEFQSAATGLADGGFAVVWTAQNGHDGSGNGIYMRQYNAAGQPLIAERRVNSVTAGDQHQARIVGLADGSYVVAWTSVGQDGSGSGVYAQYYDALGNTCGGNFLLTDNIDGDQNRPLLAALPAGGFITVWAGQDGSGLGIKVREFGGTMGSNETYPFNIIEGTQNNDLLIGSAGADRIYGYNGFDTLNGGEGNDILVGGDGNDTLYGGDGTDLMLGAAGNDILFVDALDSVIDGGDGYDTAYLQGTVGVVLDLAAAHIERVYGGTGSDLLNAGTGASAVEINGGGGDDRITGSAFNDLLRGDAGNDTIVGGDGNDTLYGGAGADLFVFTSGGSADKIVDFDAFQGDLIGLAEGQTYTIHASGGNTVITYGGTDTITLIGIQSDAISSAWFTSV